ncbi:MAG TPA: alpha-glucan family phosphorylase [Candidatus Saccharimonadales bacterium]|nr:alpha-glucan family phosphorylase [Candidatus Saccharimonadales bacterium]
MPAHKKNKIQVAYFSMEIMLRTHIPTYAGGLGILAGDLLRSCADMQIPAVGVTLVYNGKAFNQVFNPDGSQSYIETDWRKNDQFIRLPEQITLSIDGEEILINCWRYDIVGYSEFIVPVYLLDTDHYKNDPWKRKITEDLYGGDGATRICQEIVLGIGGVKMLRTLGYNDIDIFHMNEGHSTFAPLGLLPEMNYQDAEVKKHCVFTTHTPIPEGHDTFSYDMAWKYAGNYLPWHIKQLAGEDKLDMTVLGLSMSKYSFGVSKKHGEITQKMFPNFNTHAITNGVLHRTWTGSTMQDLYNEYLPGWIEDPTILNLAPEKIPDDKLWVAHQECKKLLVNFINKHLTSITSEEERNHPDYDELFDVETLTISLARRPVPYKRPLLIYHDLERLVRLSAGRIQIIQSGKAHPGDENSKEIIRKILEISKKLKGVVRIVYLENYSPTISRLLVSGTDIWLNTPLRPLEASGTSGMKAAMNGGINFSVLDGWWIEGYEMCPKAGFSIGPLSENNDEKDAEDMYDKLENQIIPLYYENRPEWIKRMKYAITLGAYFNTNRCIKEYKEKAWSA